MSDKTAKATKADLMKMLAEAVLNTPGATRLEPADTAPIEPTRKKQSAPKRVTKTKIDRASSSRKQRRR
jgi:hypothetical protein